jgi:hypothetical protein
MDHGDLAAAVIHHRENVRNFLPEMGTLINEYQGERSA